MKDTSVSRTMILALLGLSVLINVGLLWEFRKRVGESEKRAEAARRGLSATSQMLFEATRTEIASSCLVDLLEARIPQSASLKKSIAEEHKSEVSAGIECQQQPPDRSEGETLKLVDDAIRREMENN
jgi:hypothetical protein